jgi:hypothetical protein
MKFLVEEFLIELPRMPSASRRALLHILLLVPQLVLRLNCLDVSREPVANFNRVLVSAQIRGEDILKEG